MIVAREGSSEAGIAASASASTPAAAVVIADRELRIVHAQGVASDLCASAVEDWRGLSLLEVLPAESLAELEPRYRAALTGMQQSFEYSSPDGVRTLSVQITPVRARSGAVTSVVAVMQDVGERSRVGEELLRSEARLRESELLVGVGSWELIPESGVITYSEGFARLMRLSAGESLDLPGFLRLVDGEDHEVVAAAIAECLRTGSAACEFRVVGVDGAVSTVAVQGEAVWAVDGRPTYLRGALLDVTEARAAEREHHTATSLFRQSFDAAPIGMGLTDLEGGRYVRVNDALCRLLGRATEELIGASIDSVTHPDDRLVDREARGAMLQGTLSSFEGDKRYLRPDGSAVWATLHVAPVHGADGSVESFFSRVIDITDRKAREARLEQELSDAVWLGRIRDAIDDDRLVLYRQPIVDLRTGETVQQELLLRMIAEDGAIIAPGEFLPVAERYGLIAEIDRWVLRQAVDLAARGEPTEVNLSAASISDPGILLELASALERTGADPALLVVEVTETAMMDQLDDGRRFAEDVAALGCQLALDDFGTGFASLSYLKHIPAQHLKIDIEFVRDLIRSETDERLVRGIIAMAREFDQTTIAEGIEDEATLVRLRELGVHLGQGYLFGRPGPVADAASPRPQATARAVHHTPGADPLAVVRAGFAAFSARDLGALLEVCHPETVLRPSRATSELTGRNAPYRGHDGIRAYFDDVADVWKSLNVTPTAFRSTSESVIVFGRMERNPGPGTTARDVLWVCRLRDGLIAAVEAFQTAPRPRPAAPRTVAALRQSPPSGPPGGGRRASGETVSVLAGKYCGALRVGSSAEAERVIDEALMAGVAPAAIQANVIEPAMAHIGELWESNTIGVAEEHLATAISHRVLDRLLNALTVAPPRSRERVLLAAVEGQHHVLGLRMIADVLEGAGFDVLFLSADVPLNALRGFVAEHQPAVIGLSFGIATGASHLAQAISAIHEVCPEPRIMLGGQAIPPALRNAGYPFVTSSLEVVQAVQHLLDSPPQTLSPILPVRTSELGRSVSAARLTQPVMTIDRDSLTPTERDTAAARRDTAAEQRDAAAERREQARAADSAGAHRRETAAAERDTAADRRDIIADERGNAAQTRDTTADDRELVAHERDIAADERERAAAERDTAADNENENEAGRLTQKRRDAQRQRETAADARDIAEEARDAMRLTRAGANARRKSATEERNTQTDRRDQLAHERNSTQRTSATRDEAAVRDREDAARDRSDGSQDRRYAAQDRRHAAHEHAQASTDGLTGTLRRERGMAALQHAVDQARPEGRLVLAFIDVDGLKAVNDAHGHAAGDQLLCDVAEALTTQLLPNDVVIRYGGDEFICALPGADLEAARARFDEVKSSLKGRTPEGSVSIGMATLKSHETLDQLTARADAALYAGRHRRRDSPIPAK